MAIDNFVTPPLRHMASFVSSGTFSVPETSTRLYVTVISSQSHNYQGPRGPAGIASGYVNVVPGGTAQVVIGAAGATGSTVSQGGTTSFDGAIIVTGSQGGYSGRYGPQTGGIGVATIYSSLPTQAPAGAATRVTSASTTSSDLGATQNGLVHIYG